MRLVDFSLQTARRVSEAVPSPQRILQAAGALYFSTTHIAPPETAAWLIARRLGRFLPAAFLRSPRKTEFLLLRTDTGAPIPFYYNGTDVPLDMMNCIFGDKIWNSPFLQPSSVYTVIDCGGHIGFSAAWFLRRFPKATLHVFEPGVVNHHHLKLNIHAWNAEARVVLNQSAVWSSCTQRQLFHYPQGSIGDSLFSTSSASSELVPTTRLDHYLQDLGIKKVDLLKLNIEGSELEALQGLGERIRDVRVIMGEIHPDFVDPESVLGFLKENGFRTTLRHRPSMLFEAVAADVS